MFHSRRIAMGADVFRDEWSLAFDGTNDCIATEADTSSADATYTWWMKSSTTSDNRSVFGHGGEHLGGFSINRTTTDKPLYYLGTDGGGYAFQYWADTPAQDDGQWHHWALVADVSDITACKLYVDGILIAVDSTLSSGSATAYTEGLVIGANRAAGGAGYSATCQISDFALYNTLLTIGQIKTIYNGREPFNHKESSFVSNLTSWWRMGDGTLDDFQNLDIDGDRFGIVSDEVDAALGSNLITDVDGQAGAAYGAANMTEDSTEQVYIGTKSVKFVPTSSDDGIRYTAFTTVTGKLYKASVYVYTTETGGSLRLKLNEGDGSGTARYADYSVPSAGVWHKYTSYFKEKSGGSGAWLIVSSSGATSGTYYVDSPSFQLVSGNPGVVLNTSAGNVFSRDGL